MSERGQIGNANGHSTGTVFHIDFSAIKFLSKEFFVSAIVSHYEQITGDSGPGTTLGPFKGQVIEIGAAAS